MDTIYLTQPDPDPLRLDDTEECPYCESTEESHDRYQCREDHDD